MPRERRIKLKSVLAYISENYKETLSTQSVAEHFGYNREYFCRIFKRYSNMTFKEYLTGVRLDAVLREMRISKESCAQIALLFLQIAVTVLAAVWLPVVGRLFMM